MTVKELREEILNIMHELILEDESNSSAETRAKLMICYDIINLTFKDSSKEGWNDEETTLRAYIEAEHRWYRRLVDEDTESDDLAQTAYDRGRRDAYYAVLKKMKKEETNESYEGIH